MIGRALLFSILALAACGPAAKSPVFSVPERIGEEYSLASTADIAAAEIPDGLARLGVRYAVRARYAGPAELRVSFYEMSSAAAAFEAAQQWRAAPGKIYLHHGPWFVALESPSLDTAALNRLATRIESVLP